MSFAVDEFFGLRASRADAQPEHAIPGVHGLPHRNSRLQRELGLLQPPLGRGQAMTNQTNSLKCLYGSPAGTRLTGFFTLTVAAILMTAAGAPACAQDQAAGG